jgi:hypothetical protein
MSTQHRQLTATLAPALLLIAIGVVILAQLAPAIPIAAAISLAGWGSALALSPRRGAFLLAAIVYAPIVTFAIASQIDAASTHSLWRQFIAAVDAGAAFALLFQLARRV